ncbi:lysylphosphatidylglycerol synthase transmembrane domain-containing protein [Halanaerobaculum tunisiense]
MKQLRNNILLAVSCSLVVILLLTLCTINEETWQSLQKLNKIYILVIIAIMLFVWFINGYKLQILAKGVDCKIPLLAAIEIGLVGSFFANITPSGIGGQPIKIVALTKLGISSGKASAVVIVELILRLLFFTFSLPLIFIKLHSLFVSYVNPSVLIGSVSFFMLGLLVMIYLLLYHPRYLVLACFWLLNRKIIAKLINRKKIFAWKRELAREIRIFYQTLWRYLQAGRWELTSGLLLTIVSWLAQFSVIYFIIKSLHLEIDLGYLLLVQLLIYIIIIFIPVPGGSGVEVILASLLSNTLSLSEIGIIVASWRFFTYYTTLFLGGVLAIKVFDLGQ